MAVALSAMARPEDRQDGLKAGADEYVLKPFSPRALTIVLRDLVAGTPPDALTPARTRT